MAHSLSSLVFRGSVVEAISEAKQQKKLFVVYTGGDNEESKVLETSTWIDSNVSESVSKYCILLHLLEGSSEASNFSAIYPQSAAPCITVVGYNGVQLWQKVGLVNADVLASSLEKSWLSLHFQETTAAFLSAALASGKQVASEAPVSSSEQETPGANLEIALTAGHVLSSDSVQSSHSQTTKDWKNLKDSSKEIDFKKEGETLPESDAGQSSRSRTTKAGKNQEDSSKEIDFKKDVATLPESSPANVLNTEEPTFKGGTVKSKESVKICQNKPEVACPVPQKNLNLSAVSLGSSNEVSREIASKNSKSTKVKDLEYPKEVVKDDTSDASAIKSNDVFLNIKLPDGSSLQAKFFMMDTLKMVKDYINQTSSLSSFSIAIPYPRKIFSDQDLGRTLSELGLSNRQALVVVSHNPNTSHYRGGSSDHQTNPSVETRSSNTDEGYWSFVRRILSYANPFSYGRSPSSESASQESEGGMWQYSPNPSLHNALRNGGRPSPSASSDQSPPATGSNSKQRQPASRFGANIHTLRHDEDDDGRFADRNAFWNGNSTQYGGGDNDGK